MIAGNWHKQERPIPPRARHRGPVDQGQINRERGTNWTYEKYLRTLQFVSKCGMLILFFLPAWLLMMLPKSWFTAGLNQLKAVPEDSLSPISAIQVEPASTITAFTPSLPSLTPPNADEQLQLPLSREMALYVTWIVERITGAYRIP
jgi:hypothetical protein